MADKPSISWDESNPSGTQARSLGDNRIREFKTQVREILEEDHVLESSGQDTDWGYHKKVTLQEQASDPTYVANTVMLYSKEEGVNSKSALYFQDEEGNVVQLTEGANFIAGISGEIRMWSGSIATIPTGWILCNGSSGTPDLRNKFIIAANADVGGVAKTTITGSAAASGGATTHTHAYSLQGPSHTHTITDISTYTAWSVERGASADSSDAPSGAQLNAITAEVGGTGNVTGTITATAATEIPPFYALAFMQKS